MVVTEIRKLWTNCSLLTVSMLVGLCPPQSFSALCNHTLSKVRSGSLLKPTTEVGLNLWLSFLPFFETLLAFQKLFHKQFQWECTIFQNNVIPQICTCSHAVFYSLLIFFFHNIFFMSIIKDWADVPKNSL